MPQRKMGRWLPYDMEECGSAWEVKRSYAFFTFPKGLVNSIISSPVALLTDHFSSTVGLASTRHSQRSHSPRKKENRLSSAGGFEVASTPAVAPPHPKAPAGPEHGLASRPRASLHTREARLALIHLYPSAQASEGQPEFPSRKSCNKLG